MDLDLFLVGEDAKCTATACKLLRFACLLSGSVVSAADTSKSSSLLLLFLRSVPSFTSLDGSGSIRSMAGPALSMALQQLVDGLSLISEIHPTVLSEVVD